MRNILCPYEKCKHYWSTEKYGKKCYYEVQCWRGDLALWLYAIRERFQPKGENH